MQGVLHHICVQVRFYPQIKTLEDHSGGSRISKNRRGGGCALMGNFQNNGFGADFYNEISTIRTKKGRRPL